MPRARHRVLGVDSLARQAPTAPAPPAPQGPPMTRELVSAAARYTTRTAKTTAQNPARSQQARAWGFYRTPEVRSFANWIGNAMSGARLYAGRYRPDGSIEPAPDGHPAALHVAGIAGGADGQSQLLREYGRHLAVAGEGWTVIRPREDGRADWHVVSVLEISSKGSSGLEAEIDGRPVAIPAHDPDVVVPDLAPVAIRVWDPSPERHLEADSPVLAALDELEELRLLGAVVRAVAQSRLTGRGVLLIPQGTRFPTSPGQSDAEDDLLDVFMQVAETAIREPDSAAATVPIILEVPPESIGQIQHLVLRTDFDELAIKLREENIRRFATAADIPGEFLLGLGDVNHWGAWELTSEAIRLGIEPRLRVVAHAYTEQWLRPLLEDEGVPDAVEWMVLADSSPLRVRTNRSSTAIEVHKLGAISDAALRRETGFDEADAPTTAPAEQTEDTVPTTPTTPLPADEATDIPDTLPASAHAPAPAPGDPLVAAVDGLLWHALHQAGEKLRRSGACPRDRRAEARRITASRRHTVYPVTREEVDALNLLDGVLDRAPEIAARYGADPTCLQRTLTAYLRELMAAGVEYDHTHVRPVVAGCLTEAA
ncbi:hypothetical protein G3I42_26565 [Streptomyces sp. SID11385]|nr:hypothetical protein [Streptomyces sp. SID11385]